MRVEAKPLLLVGLSARMLAQSAQRGHYPCYTVDLFADQDTRRMALRCDRVTACGDDLDSDAWLEQIRTIRQETGVSRLVYGSGLDTRPELVAHLSRLLTVTGNLPERLQQVRQPDLFFKLLDRLGIAHPSVRFNPPVNDTGNWLLKTAHHEGGRGVSVYSGDINRGPESHCYFQRQLTGPSYSVLFLANGVHSRVVGFNTQYTVRLNADRPFTFHRIINCATLSASQRQQLSDAIAGLVQATALRGLNSLDFMLNDGVCQILELNPRPSASMTLYDADYPKGLLHEHLLACDGQWGHQSTQDPVSPVRAYGVVYAPADVLMPVRMRWPKWSADQPAAGSLIASGQAICSIQACGPHSADVLRQLEQRETELLNRMYSVRLSA